MTPPTRPLRRDRRACRRAFLLGVEALESRRLLSAFTVRNTNDSGTGSFRQAILDSDAAPGVNTIGFDIVGSGVQTITPQTALPTITVPVTIDGYTQPGSRPNSLVNADNAVLLIVLDGHVWDDSTLTLSATGTTVRGLVLNRPAGSHDSILITGPGGDTIAGDFLGTDPTGTIPLGGAGIGLSLQGAGNGLRLQSDGNTIGGIDPSSRNIISGNGANDVLIDGGADNLIEGNFIGIDATGLSALPNPADVARNLPFYGVRVEGTGNTIGGTTAGARNVISGATIDVLIQGAFERSAQNTAEGNFIGTNASGSSVTTGYNGNGVEIIGSTGNTIGGTTLGARNVISTGTGYGLIIEDATTSRSFNNTIQGNDIGTNVNGQEAIGNILDVDIASASNTLGGTDPGAGNVIAGTSENFPAVDIEAGPDVLVEGNFIGISRGGSTALLNNSLGVLLQGGASGDTIGGTTAGSGNVIADNEAAGVAILEGCTDDAILTNSIFGNAGLGIDLGNGGVILNTPGGPHIGPDDLQNYPVITSVVPGLSIETLGGTFNSTPNTTFMLQFFGNIPGTTPGTFSGQSFLGSTNVTTDGAGNATFSDNVNSFVGSYTATATDPNGNTSEFSAPYTPTAAAANPLVVTTTADSGPGSLRAAITYTNANFGNNTISFAIPGTGVQRIALLSPLPNVTAAVVIDGTTQPGFAGTPIVELDGVNAGPGSGLILYGGGITVRGLVVDRFQFAGLEDTGDGIVVGGNYPSGDPVGDLVEGNYIGVSSDGITPLGNGAEGVAIESSSRNTIGGTTAGTGNVIADNGGNGIFVSIKITGDVTNDNVIEGNLIGTNAADTIKLGNGGQGVFLANTSNTTVGGLTAAAGNVIAGSGANGIEMVDAPNLNNVILNNFIGTDRTGSLNLGNFGAGIVVVGEGDLNGNSGNTIGDTVSGSGNVIAFNAGAVEIDSGYGLPILENSIYSNNNGNGIGYAFQAHPLVSPPILTSVTAAPGGGTIIQGTFVGFNEESARLEFFSNNVKGQQQGKVFLGSTTVTTNSDGYASFDTTLPAVLSGTQYITATATGRSDTTSGFSTEIAFTAGTVAASADLSIVGSAVPFSAVAGSLLTYTFTVKNSGPSPATGVTLTDALPTGLTFGPVSATQGTAHLDGSTVTASLGNLAVGASATVTIAVTPTGAEALSDTARVSGNEPDPAAANNASTLQTTVAQSAPNPLVVTTTADSGPGSLRAAVTYANVNPGVDTISFAIPGTGVQTIAPLSPLPALSTAVIIDGYTQPLAHPNTLVQGDDAKILIEINGALTGGGGLAASNGDGLVFSGGNSTVRGLAIDGFTAGAAVHLLTLGGDTIAGDFLGTGSAGTAAKPNRIGVQVETAKNTVGGTTPAARDLVSANTFIEVYLLGAGATGNTVEGDYVGTNAAGTASLSNPGGGDGVDIDFGASSNTVGGMTAGARNVLSGNGASGVRIAEAGTNSNVVQGNDIGTDVSGTRALGNAFHGVLIQRGAINNQIGGHAPGTGNVISANAIEGVTFADATTTGNSVQGNLIGTDRSGTLALGNQGDGVSASFSAFNNTIGGTAAGAGNTVAFNGGDGVNIIGGAGNLIASNSIFGNLKLGIDLGDDGVTPNTPGGKSTGSNDLQDFPVISSAAISGDRVEIVGTLGSRSNSTFRVEFFANTAPDPSGFGQGQTFIGSTLVATNADGNARFDASFNLPAAVGRSITATATDSADNTSEFSADRTSRAATADLSLTETSQPNPAVAGGRLTFTLTAVNKGPDPATGVGLTEVLPPGVVFVSAATTQGVVARSGGAVTATLGALANGESARVTIVVALTAAVTLTDSARVQADQADPNPANNSVTTKVGVGLSAPVGLTATPDGTGINLAWTPSPGAVSYRVYRSTPTGGGLESLYKSGLAPNPGSKSIAFRDTGAAAGKTYYYQVTAVAVAAESPRSSEAHAMIPTLVAPTNVFASLIDEGNGTYSVFVTWGYSGPSGGISFDLYRSTVPNGEGQVPHLTNASGHYLILPVNDTIPGTTYYFKVAAVQNGKQSFQSAEAKVTVPPRVITAFQRKLGFPVATKVSQQNPRA